MTKPATLHLLCGKMASGKSTLAASLVASQGAVLLSEDALLKSLYPAEIVDLKVYIDRSARLKHAIAELIVDLLRRGISVVLDFPANTPGQRAWLKTLFTSAQVAHQLHFLDTPDEICKQQLRSRNAGRAAEVAFQDEATFDLLATYFVPPTSEEQFNVLLHKAADATTCAMSREHRDE